MGRALANPLRWAILAALLKHEVLPSPEIAKYVGASRANVSKQMTVLLNLGLVERWHRTLYRIPQRFRVPGEMAVDLGCAVLRLDQLG